MHTSKLTLHVFSANNHVPLPTGIVHAIDKVISPASTTIVQNVVGLAGLSTLVSVVTMSEYAPILEALSGEGPLTLFAPSDAAFAAANIDVSDVAAVTAVLQHHVVSGAVSSSDLKATQNVATLNGGDITVSVTNGIVTVNDAVVIVANVLGTNGIVHVIDHVLLPAVDTSEFCSYYTQFCELPGQWLVDNCKKTCNIQPKPVFDSPYCPNYSQWCGHSEWVDGNCNHMCSKIPKKDNPYCVYYTAYCGASEWMIANCQNTCSM